MVSGREIAQSDLHFQKFTLAAVCRRDEGGPGRGECPVGRALHFPRRQSMHLALGLLW